MTLAIMQAVIKATKTAIMPIREADNLVNNTRQVHAAPRSGSSAQQPTCDWKAADKYQILCNFEIKAKNIFMTNSYNTLNDITLVRLRGSQVCSVSNDEGQEKCRRSMGLFKLLSKKLQVLTQ